MNIDLPHRFAPRELGLFDRSTGLYASRRGIPVAEEPMAALDPVLVQLVQERMLEEATPADVNIDLSYRFAPRELGQKSAMRYYDRGARLHHAHTGDAMSYGQAQGLEAKAFGSSVERRASPVEDVIAVLEKQLADIVGLTDALQSRLDPVLNPQTKNVADDGKHRQLEAVQAALLSSLGALSQRMQNVSERLRDTLDRCVL